MAEVLEASDLAESRLVGCPATLPQRGDDTTVVSRPTQDDAGAAGHTHQRVVSAGACDGAAGRCGYQRNGT